MVALTAALAAISLLISQTTAQETYTVWASVIFSRTGERTPEYLGNLPTVSLTSVGANQQYAAGTYYRERYLVDSGSPDGIDTAPMQGLSANPISLTQLYPLALDEQFNVASAQAFLQGLYPPSNLSAGGDMGQMIDPTSILADGNYVMSPIDGYQYPWIRVAGSLDPEFTYLGGSFECPAFNGQVLDFGNSSAYEAVAAESLGIYQAVAPYFVEASELELEDWNYGNAYNIYDFLSYQNTHNRTAAQILSQDRFYDPHNNISYLDSMQWYADQQQWAELGNLNATNNLTNGPLPNGTPGSISTIAGNLLAAKILTQLETAISSNGQLYRLSILFGDYQPLMSFFALANLAPFDSPSYNNFTGVPAYGATAVFELYSWTNDTLSLENADFPTLDELYVRFYFRNGTDNETASFMSWPLFHQGPIEQAVGDMSWIQFQAAMYEIALEYGDWCTQCGASNIFCAAWNASDSYIATPSDTTSGGHLSPVVSGVVGAIIALVVAALIFAAVMFLAGVRFHRVQKPALVLRHRKSELGGFKGSQKLASDKDLTIPKGGAIVGASIEREPSSPVSPIGGAHERVGSWELRQAGGEGRPNIAAFDLPKHSFDADEISANPFRDPVKVDERV